MSNVIELDFTGAPPAQGGGSDRVPPGRYVLKISEIRATKTQKGKQMIVANYDIAGPAGEHVGKQLRDQFVLTPGETGSKFGLQRFHAFLVACGGKMAQGKVKFDLDNLVGKALEAQVGDQELAANDEYEARVVSQPRAYYALGARPAQASPAAAPAAPKAAAPKAAAPKAAPKAAPAPAPEPEPDPFDAEAEEVSLDDSDVATDITEEVDDIFN